MSCLKLASLISSKESLSQSAAALSGSFAPDFQFESLEIHKIVPRFSNLNLEQNLSLTALAIDSELPNYKLKKYWGTVNHEM